MKKRKVVKDTRERITSLCFEDKDYCSGVINKALKTGDYCLEGLEKKFCIERKGSVGELSGNLTKTRFTRELERMDLLEHSFIICEFTFEDLCRFPFGSGIPKSRWRRLKISSGFLIRRIIEIETSYKVKIIFAGDQSQRIIDAILKRMAILYDKEN